MGLRLGLGQGEGQGHGLTFLKKQAKSSLKSDVYYIMPNLTLIYQFDSVAQSVARLSLDLAIRVRIRPRAKYFFQVLQTWPG